MASIKVKFRPSAVADHEGAVYYQIIQSRKVRHLLTDYRIYPDEWDAEHSMVSAGVDARRHPIMRTIRRYIKSDIERLRRIVSRYESNGLAYEADDVINEFRRLHADYSLSAFMENIITRLRQNGKLRTSETYRATLNSFRKFLKIHSTYYSCKSDIMLDCLDSEIMEAYEAWNVSRGITPNTISFYNRILRAVYNRAVENNLIESNYPFRHVYTGIDKTVKRAIPLSVIRKIKTLDLATCPALDYARDMFIMSFMLRGMSFIDMAFLRKTDKVEGYVSYRRRKTGQRLVIEWTKEMQMILDKYPENKSEYLLPIICKTDVNELCAYRNAGYRINRNLKIIARVVGLSIPLTLYVARHSWASVAQSKGIPVSVISKGMGHDSESTTRIYLASLDTSIVDRANSIILQSL